MTTILGLENFLAAHTELVAGRRVALLACPSSVDRQLRSATDLLHGHPAVNLVALFGPEHGIRGEAQAGAKVENIIDPATSLPAHSLYGATQTPTADMLRDIDLVIIDLQDAGVRFYTFVATMLYVMRAAAAAGIGVIVLDRPAPITGARLEGPLLEPAYASFVGPARLPIRYGMTIGELALLLNAEVRCELTVIPLRNWRRELWYDQTGLPFVPSSPNLPTLDAVTLYPGACLIEGANLSEGRGTTRPFEYIGAPWLDAEALSARLNGLGLAGARFRPVYFVPTFSKYAGQVCAGVHVYASDREVFQPVAAMLQLLQMVKRAHPAEFAWRAAWSEGAHPPIDLLWGGDGLRRQIDADAPVAELIEGWGAELESFRQRRADYLLY